MKSSGKFFKLILLVGFSALAVFAWTNQQAIEDWWKLKDYTPPSSVVALADKDTMTGSARRIFYVNHPQLITDTLVFRQKCPESEQTIVLGCYHSGQSGIDIRDVQDPRLSGVEEVTAAHEMLHAAYDRLNDEEKSKIDNLLNNYYQTVQDPRLIDTINSYRQSEPGEVVNEMHSIFGTEVLTLPQPLEDYYKRYFVDRRAVVQLANGYEEEFSSRLARISTYDQQLANLKQQIDESKQQLDDQLAQLEAERNRLNQLRSSGDVGEYNAAVAEFNKKVNAYNQGVAKLKSDIARYNQLVEERNSIVGELRSLNEALDTRLAPQSAQ